MSDAENEATKMFEYFKRMVDERDQLQARVAVLSEYLDAAEAKVAVAHQGIDVALEQRKAAEARGAAALRILDHDMRAGGVVSFSDLVHNIRAALEKDG